MMALSPDLGAAGNVLVFIVCTCNWFNGIIVPYSQIQVFWRYWVSQSISASRLSGIPSDKDIALLLIPIYVPSWRNGDGRDFICRCVVLISRPHSIYCPC